MSGGSASSASMTSWSNSVSGRSGGGMAASFSLRSVSRWYSRSDISSPVSATTPQAVSRTIASTATSRVIRSFTPRSDGGFRSRRVTPAMNAAIAAARSGGPKVSLIPRG